MGNADDLYRAAQSAAGIGNFGCAVALAVLTGGEGPGASRQQVQTTYGFSVS